MKKNGQTNAALIGLILAALGAVVLIAMIMSLSSPLLQ